jgi:arginase family enzyme
MPPTHDGPTAIVPVAFDDIGTELTNGATLTEHSPPRVTMRSASYSAMILNTCSSWCDYPDYHAMAVANLLGHGDPDIQKLLPATVSVHRVALAGLHSWTDGDFPHIAEWGLTNVRTGRAAAVKPTAAGVVGLGGCSRVAIHLDVDVVDSDETVFGLGPGPGGLTSAQVRRLVNDIGSAADVVGLTIAEFIPRQSLPCSDSSTASRFCDTEYERQD